jgi:hypothetical protein
MTKLEITPSVDVVVNGVSYPTELVNGVQRFRANKAVEFLVEANGLALNGLVMAMLNGEIPLEDYIVFHTMHGYSVGGFVDALESNIGLNPDIFPGAIEDYFTIENPLWAEEA